MASIQKTTQGYRAQIKLKGTRESKLFRNRRDAVEWAARRETEIRDKHEKPSGELYTLRQALQRYANEVAVNNKGARWDETRLAAFERYLLPLDGPIGKVSGADIALFRDSRLRSIKPASVSRELSLLSSVFETARKEWRWVTTNPCRDIRKPKRPRHRQRTITIWEVCELRRVVGYQRIQRPQSISQAVMACMMMALHTGMRAGELTELAWDRVHANYVALADTKNDDARDVPLSHRAKQIIEAMRGWDDRLVFGISSASLDALFRKHRVRAGLDGFTFHDTRHTAATIMARKVDLMTLCKIFGWRDPKYALVYYNPTAESIAARL